MTSACQDLQQSRQTTISAILEYTASQKEVAHAKKLEMQMMLKNTNKERDDEDSETYNVLKKGLFGR